MEPRDVFVTGTDTGVGKTLVSAAIAACWRASGADVTYVKPVQSGVDDGDDDCRDVARAAPGTATVVGPAFGESLAPAVAARRAGVSLAGTDLARVVDDVTVASPASRLVVEGAGGLLVELGTDGTTCADLASMVSLPVVVVVRPGLGTLNHTALTISELKARAMRFVGVVVSGYPPDPDLATRTNLVELDRLAMGRLVGVVPQLSDAGHDLSGEARSWFTEQLGGTAERRQLLKLSD